ncbi:class I SAM-dependent methyltransferase [Subsaximicrobium wynnwilliamsii]|uniref:Class I SAM-dependent methyltransferase n=1 Tax=Subsaximicrobium wynnwilliamsii TaxID=291179 RepID=A0A5C6ZCF2_9FLAO|nr:class I SAM-dependent methyltransferase [Subsaximicrobium wynnwilliamsii]TXD81714.1 class I SAM-dependent methyltransferase [Subsaximicrobium wynnwilliamsii]TXD87469.1 class I SAM-dependent methyltransferase [Subsaximicrobium wynnwilliamsii]TXE01157.1 class I SAM-dependent methyltransferase [Subsaximicrobium wynnwilliamsii]
MFQYFQYLKFLSASTNQHGVHSPFVYDLVTKCFYDSSNYGAYEQLSAYRNALLSDQKSIAINDFGAGSKVFKSDTRVVSQMAKHSGSTLKRAKLVFRLVKYLQPKTTLELGTHLGIATQALALGASGNQVVSVEGCAQTSEMAKTQLKHFGIDNVSLKTGRFEDLLPQLKQQNYDLIFFDGNHSKSATLHYFEELLETTHNESVFIFDDIHWSKGMNEAWELIKRHPKVSVSIDTFFWGLVFFRSEQEKQHFKIRV